ncbi:nitrate reductase [Candidatus Kaiserbacteria bacterium]|nr:nitrate reductase [Candidatus Kaiserbacteria bacterium]
MLNEVSATRRGERPRQDVSAWQAAATRTTCPYCGVGCGVLASPNGKVAGDPAHPANYGQLCSKGSALGETLGLDGRLLYPMRRQEDGRFVRITWDMAFDEAVSGFRHIIDEHGPDAVAVYLSGQLLTEDYYVANKLMKGFVGTANVDTNSRLCMASTVAGHKRAFGGDVVPGCYEDLDEADLIILVGSNAAWCHPVLFQRMIRSREERGTKIVAIDTRRTPTAESADFFLHITPGGDQALFSGLLNYLAHFGALDEVYIERHTTGFQDALVSARGIAPTIGATARSTGLRESDVAAFFELFARTPRTVTAFSQGVNQSAQGTDKVNAIINCHLATGRVGRRGASPLSLTGQPNAMGGREVGGLANNLAAHMGFDAESIDRVRRFWNAPRMAVREGHKAVQMFEAIARGEIKALWVVGTNPAASLPNANAVRAALSKLNLCIVSDNVLSNDTIKSGAHLLLPALAWGEKDGTVTNSERRISRQRAFSPSPGEVRADWEIFTEFAQRMGFAGFDYRSAADVFREHAALSGFENEGARVFNIGGLANISAEEYEALEPIQWPIPDATLTGRARLFHDGRFAHHDERANFIATKTPTLAVPLSAEFPLRLNTGRIRDQWHTMTRTGSSPRLARHLPEPFVEVSPQDATLFDLENGGFGQVTTPHGSCILRVIVTDTQPAGQIFAPIHWTDETASHARVGCLVAPIVDPYSGQPESKASVASIAPTNFSRQGFLVCRQPVELPPTIWWARVKLEAGYGYRIACELSDDDWLEHLRLFTGEDVIALTDVERGLARGAAFAVSRVEYAWALDRRALSWDTMLEQFAFEQPDRLAILNGGASHSSKGSLVCACFGVSHDQIAALVGQGILTPSEIGAACNAGTNCGSCVPEIRRIASRR